MCLVEMETKDGGHCKAAVTCDDGKKEYNPGGADWNVCYVGMLRLGMRATLDADMTPGGRQYFTDPRIGDFSITFTEKNGEGQGEGLTTPNLQLKYVGDWHEIPVNDLCEASDRYHECEDCIGDGTGCSPFRECEKGPFICQWG